MAPPSDNLTSTVFARLLVRELDARQLDTDGVLAAAGLSRAVVDQVDGEVPWAQWLRLFEEILARAPGEDFSLTAGTRSTLADLDLPGLYLRSTRSGRAAYEFYLSHSDLIAPAPLALTYMTDDAFVVALPERERTPVQAAVAEFTLSTAITLARLVVGPGMQPVESRFRHARPDNCDAHTRILGKTSFGCHVDALYLPIDLLDQPLPFHDGAIQEVLEPHLQRRLELVQAAKSDLRSRALAAIHEELAQGQASLPSLARRLRTSERSLRRELQAEGTSYSQLVSEVRHKLALQHVLETPRRNGPELAEQLGYANAHTFYRAFKRWTGMSLTAYRKQRDR